MTRVLAATIAATVLGGVVIVAAQAQAPTQAPVLVQAQAQTPAPARTPTSRPDPKTGRDAAGRVLPKYETFIGCLQLGEAPEATVVGASRTSFVLENAMMAGSSAAPKALKLEGFASPGVNLASWVGSKVEINGVMMAEKGTFSMRTTKQVAPSC